MQTQQATTITLIDSPTGQRLHELRYQMDLGNWESSSHLAARAIRSAVLEDPARLPEAQEDLATIWRVRQRIPPAVALLRRAARGYQALDRAADSRRCLLRVVEILLDAGHAQRAQEALEQVGRGYDTFTLRGRLYALQGESYQLTSIARYLRRDSLSRGPDEWLVLALHEQMCGRIQTARDHLEKAMNLAAIQWDMWAMQRITRAKEQMSRA